MGIFFSRAVQGYFLYLRTNANTPYCRPMVRWRAEGPISPFPFPASPLVSMTRWRFWGGIPQLCIEQFLDTDVFARSSSTVHLHCTVYMTHVQFVLCIWKMCTLYILVQFVPVNTITCVNKEKDDRLKFRRERETRRNIDGGWATCGAEKSLTVSPGWEVEWG